MPMRQDRPFGEGFLPGQVRVRETAATLALKHRWGDLPAIGVPPNVAKHEIKRRPDSPPKTMSA